MEKTYNPGEKVVQTNTQNFLWNVSQLIFCGFVIKSVKNWRSGSQLDTRL